MGKRRILGERYAAFDQDYLGGCLDELLRGADRARRIVWNSAPRPFQFDADTRCVGDVVEAAFQPGGLAH
jgi:hypothetical protein